MRVEAITALRKGHHHLTDPLPSGRDAITWQREQAGQQFYFTGERSDHERICSECTDGSRHRAVVALVARTAVHSPPRGQHLLGKDEPLQKEPRQKDAGYTQHNLEAFAGGVAADHNAISLACDRHKALLAKDPRRDDPEEQGQAGARGSLNRQNLPAAPHYWTSQKRRQNPAKNGIAKLPQCGSWIYTS